MTKKYHKFIHIIFIIFINILIINFYFYLNIDAKDYSFSFIKNMQGYSELNAGFHLVPIFSEDPNIKIFDFLDHSFFEGLVKLSYFDSNNRVFKTAYQDHDQGNAPSGVNFKINSVSSYIIYNTKPASIPLSQNLTGQHISIKAGFNMVNISFPSLEKYTSYSILKDLEKTQNIKSIGRYCEQSGKWQDSYYFFGRQSGIEYNINTNEVYIFNSTQTQQQKWWPPPVIEEITSPQYCENFREFSYQIKIIEPYPNELLLYTASVSGDGTPNCPLYQGDIIDPITGKISLTPNCTCQPLTITIEATNQQSYCKSSCSFDLYVNPLEVYLSTPSSPFITPTGEKFILSDLPIEVPAFYSCNAGNIHTDGVYTFQSSFPGSYLVEITCWLPFCGETQKIFFYLDVKPNWSNPSD